MLRVDSGLRLALTVWHRSQETAPLRGLDRNAQPSWLQRELAGIKRITARLELLRWTRRVLILGLWRN